MVSNGVECLGVHRDQPMTRTSQSEQVSPLAMVIRFSNEHKMGAGLIEAIAATSGKEMLCLPLGLARSRPGAASCSLALIWEMLPEILSEVTTSFPPAGVPLVWLQAILSLAP